MSDAAPAALLAERTQAMRALSNQARAAAIAAAPNVVGHARFTARVAEIERAAAWRARMGRAPC